MAALEVPELASAIGGSKDAKLGRQARLCRALRPRPVSVEAMSKPISARVVRWLRHPCAPADLQVQVRGLIASAAKGGALSAMHLIRALSGEWMAGAVRDFV